MQILLLLGIWRNTGDYTWNNGLPFVWGSLVSPHSGRYQRIFHWHSNRIRMEVILTQIHWRKKLSHFDLKSWVTGGAKIRPGIPSNWKIFESNWLDVESQFELTLNIKSIWVNLRYWESIQIDSLYRVNLTPVFSNYSKSRVEFLFRQWLNFYVKMTQFFLPVYIERNLAEYSGNCHGIFWVMKKYHFFIGIYYKLDQSFVL